MARKKALPIPQSSLELDYAKFGDALRQTIKAKGYTQPVVAEAIGVSDSTMWSILAGKRKVELKNYLKLLDVLGMNLAPMLKDDFIENFEIYTEFYDLMSSKSAEELKNITELIKSTENS